MNFHLLFEALVLWQDFQRSFFVDFKTTLFRFFLQIGKAIIKLLAMWEDGLLDVAIVVLKEI